MEVMEVMEVMEGVPSGVGQVIASNMINTFKPVTCKGCGVREGIAHEKGCPELATKLAATATYKATQPLAAVRASSYMVELLKAAQIEDLREARDYINSEIERLTKG